MTRDDTICLAALVELVRGMLLRRQGEVVTLELARERARNIAAALQGLTVVDRAIPEKGEDDEHDPKNA